VVERVVWSEAPAEVWNLEVHRAHTYRVGGAGVLVHNEADCGPNGGTRPDEHQDLVNERKDRRDQRRENASRDAAGQPRSGQGSRDLTNSNKGSSGARPNRQGGRNRERNVGIDEEHSRVAKGAGGRGTR
jgi:hypothetical protein